MAISFKDFAKNPIVAVLFLAIIGIGYLYLENENKSTESIERLEAEIAEMKIEIRELRTENRRLNEAFRETLEKINE